MFPLTATEYALHRMSQCSRACVLNEAYVKSQIKYISSASNNYSAFGLPPKHVVQAPRFDIVFLQRHSQYIPPASINSMSAYSYSCAPSLPKHIFQAPRFNGALLQRHIKYIPSASISVTSASYSSCTPSLPMHLLQASSSPFTCSASSEPCSRLLAILPSYLEVKRSLYHSNLSCTRASTPLMKFSKSLIDRSLLPELLEKDLFEVAIKGWGPGGQAVNKSNNAVFLKHLPTGLFVKVHKHRMRHQNALEARVLLLDKLDNLVNGPRSVSAQKARLLEKRSVRNEGKARKMRDLKAQWKQALGGADASVREDSLRDEGAGFDGSIDGSGSTDGLRDGSAGFDGSIDGSGSTDGLRDEKAGFDVSIDGSGTTDGLRDESAGFDGSIDGSGSTEGLRDESGDGRANSEVGNRGQENDLNQGAQE